MSCVSRANQAELIWCSSNNGQKCIAGSRIFVQSGIYDEFLAKLTESAKAIKLGDPFDIDTAQGPVVSQIHFDVRLSRVKHSISTDGIMSARYGLHQVR